MSELADASRDSLLRDSLIGVVTNVFIACTIALALAAMVFRGPRFAVVRRVLCWVALVLLGFVVAVFASVPLRFAARGGAAAFWIFVTVLAALLATLCTAVGRHEPFRRLDRCAGVDRRAPRRRRHDRGPARARFTVGVLTDRRHPTRRPRHLAFSQLTASASLLAGLLAWRVGGRVGLRTALAVLAITFLSLTPPLWGQNFGGTLATAPAFATEGWLLSGRRLRFRNVAALGAILVSAGLVVGFLDLLRPANEQTHVGRFFQQVRDQGLSGLAMVLHRKGSENVSTFSNQAWVAILLAGIG